MKLPLFNNKRFLRFLQSITLSRKKAAVFNVMDLNKSNFFVRYNDGEDTLRITFCYEDKINNKEREFNFIRNKNEKICVALSRIKNKVLTAGLPKKKKQKSPEHDLKQTEYESLEIKVIRSGELIHGDTPNIEAWQDDTSIVVGENQYGVIVNGPEISLLALPKVILSGHLVYPKLCLEAASIEDSAFMWFRAVNKEETKLCDEMLLHRSRSGQYWYKVSDTFLYWPFVKDIGHHLKLVCTPKRQNVTGRTEEVISPNPVAGGPGKCPFEDRLWHTKDLTPSGSIRCVSYNILADAYADTETAKNELFAHCPAEFLAFDYRKQLYMKEITGYNADILCLQEVDRKVFHHDFIPVLGQFGLTGVYNEKGGQVVEGLACFFRSSKFRLLHSEGVLLCDIVSSEGILKDIFDKISENEKLKERIMSRTSALQVVLLECLDVPNKQILVGNTHLYFHPISDNVRLIQAAICIRYLELKMAKLQKEAPDIDKALVFCGDFNSCPEFGVYHLMTKGYLPKGSPDWKSNPEEAVPGLLLKHSFKLWSGCGTPAYTNFTEGFNGCLDYIFFDRNYFTVKDVVPFPTDEQVRELVALPNEKFPSDHMALICTLTWKQ